MSLYSYKKAPVEYSNHIAQREISRNITGSAVNTQFRSQLTVGDVVRGAYNDFHKLMSTSKIAAMFVPAILVITGVYIIFNQVWPTIYQQVQRSSGYFDQNSTALVAGQYVAVKNQYSNPGSRYFAELKTNAAEQNLLYTDEKSNAYKGTFSLSIPSLGLNNIKVTSNVDSGVEEIYDRLLSDGLAHFQGTNLPFYDGAAGSGAAGGASATSSNVVIYGHSSAGDYYERTKDPAASFSRLSQIRYGSEIIINFEGKEYKYKFIKGRVVKANDLSILQGQKSQKLLTLFTCYPNGNNSERFVATARLIED